VQIFTQNPNLNRLSYGFAFLFITIGSILQYITPYFYDKGDASMGFRLLVILYLGIFLANFFAPYFLARFGSQKMIFATSITYIISITAMTTHNNLLIYGGTTLLGLSGAILWNAQNSYLIGISQNHNRGAQSGFFVAVYGVGYAFGVALLGYLIELFDYQYAFYLISVFALVSVYLFFQMEELEHEKGHKHREFTLRNLRSQTLLKSVLTSYFIQSILFGIAVSIVPLHIELITHNSIIVGLLSSLFFIMPLFLSVFIGKISDKQGRGKMILMGVMMALLGLGLFHYATSVWMLGFAMVAISIAQAILFPMSIAFQADIATPQNQRAITNVFVFFKYLGMIVGILLSDLLGLEWVYLVTTLMIVSILIFAWSVLIDESRLKDKIIDELGEK
jgi:MFS family permease